MITLSAPGSTDEPTPERLDLDADPTAPARARQFVAERITAFPAQMADDVMVLVSEIVTNAVRHGSGQLSVTLAVADQVIQVDVHDDGAGRPPLEATRPGDEVAHGRGLLIVEAIATDWGVAPDPEGPGKTIWFELLSVSAG